MPVAEGVLVAIPRGGGQIVRAAVVRAGEGIVRGARLAALVLRETAANVPNRLTGVDVRRLHFLDELVWRVRHRRNLHLHIGDQEKAAPIHTLRIATARARSANAFSPSRGCF